MATWSINPENQGATIDNNGVLNVEHNYTLTRRSWELTYTDNNGITASKTVTQGSLEYVEIEGIKWATTNIGAASITDYGKYFQWGDISGYAESQIGSGSGKKYFDWASYKYSNNGGSSTTSMTKYNSSDGKIELDDSDDASIENWGAIWSMPSYLEYEVLISATTSAWTSNYEGSGVAGVILTDKTDSSKKLFFPAGGYALNGNIYSPNTLGEYWTSALNENNVVNGKYFNFSSPGVGIGNLTRERGLCIRPVLGKYHHRGHLYVDLGLPSGIKWATTNVGATSITDYGNYYQYGKGAAQYAATSGQSDYRGTEEPLAANVDTAVQVWGGDWHMPTEEQFFDLMHNTTYTWETNFKGSGINGGKFTAANGNYIFFPASYLYNKGNYGCYWSSSPIARGAAEYNDLAYDLEVNTRQRVLDQQYRHRPYTVRPVIGTEYVDLGLPSGTKWAKCNIGATSETEYGNYYQYGKGAAQYAATSGQSDYRGTENPLATSADTAAQLWGGGWRMPTQAQLQELTANTTYTWETNFKGSGINGGKFTAANGNYIFFPASGYYTASGTLISVGEGGCLWSSTPNSTNAYSLYSSSYPSVLPHSRKCGFTVRGVKVRTT